MVLNLKGRVIRYLNIINTQPYLIQKLNFHITKSLCHTCMSPTVKFFAALSLSYIAWWRHDMATLYVQMALCRGIHWSLVDSPPDEPITRALMFSLMSTETNCLVSGDLRSRDSYVTSFWSVWIDCTLVLMQRYATFTVWMLHNSMETVWNQGI